MCSDMRRELTEIPNNLYMKKNNLGIFFFRHCHEGLVPGWLSGAWSGTDDAALNTRSCFKLIFTCNSNCCFFQNKHSWLQRSLSFLYLCNIPFPLAPSPRYWFPLPSSSRCSLKSWLRQRRSEQATLEKQSTKIRRAFFWAVFGKASSPWAHGTAVCLCPALTWHCRGSGACRHSTIWQLNIPLWTPCRGSHAS